MVKMWFFKNILINFLQIKKKNIEFKICCISEILIRKNV